MFQARFLFLHIAVPTGKEKGLKKLFKRGKQTAVDSSSSTSNGPTT